MREGKVKGFGELVKGDQAGAGWIFCFKVLDVLIGNIGYLGKFFLRKALGDAKAAYMGGELLDDFLIILHELDYRADTPFFTPNGLGAILWNNYRFFRKTNPLWRIS